MINSNKKRISGEQFSPRLYKKNFTTKKAKSLLGLACCCFIICLLASCCSLQIICCWSSRRHVVTRPKSHLLAHFAIAVTFSLVHSVSFTQQWTACPLKGKSTKEKYQRSNRLGKILRTCYYSNLYIVVECRSVD